MKKKREVMIAEISLKDYKDSVEGALSLFKGVLQGCVKKEQVPIMLYHINKLLTEYFEKLNFKGIFYNEDYETIEYVKISRKDYDEIIKEIVKEKTRKKFSLCEEKKKLENSPYGSKVRTALQACKL